MSLSTVSTWSARPSHSLRTVLLPQLLKGGDVVNGDHVAERVKRLQQFREGRRGHIDIATVVPSASRKPDNRSGQRAAVAIALAVHANGEAFGGG